MTGQGPSDALLTKHAAIRNQRRPQRLLFLRIGERSGTILGAAETVAQLREDIHATSQNVGNMVHLEALPKLLRHQRRMPPVPIGYDTVERAAQIERQYDGIVLAYANIIRDHAHLSQEELDVAMAPLVRAADWLERTKCTIYALGIGIQDALEPRADAVDPRLFRLLKLLNDKAALFAVRGNQTEAWLHGVGLTNAMALGCPSLFTHPRNVMAVRPPAGERALRVATAGRLQHEPDPARLGAINRIGAAFGASYVYQADFYVMFGPDDAMRLYNDATGEVAADVVRQRAREWLGVDPAFADYWMFRATEKWRGFTIGKDAFFGDRFHGGVVFLQCGKPAIVIQNDARVAELTAFYDLPSATSAEIMASDPVELLHERLSEANLARFRATYLERYRAFRAALIGAGLELFNDIPLDELADSL